MPNAYNYLDLPINLLYKTGGLKIGGGPYVAYLLGGKYKIEESITDKNGVETATKFEQNVDFTLDRISRIDYGLNLCANYQLENGLFVSANYALGLKDIYSYTTSKNRVLSLSVGMMFGGK